MSKIGVAPIGSMLAILAVLASTPCFSEERLPLYVATTAPIPGNVESMPTGISLTVDEKAGKDKLPISLNGLRAFVEVMKKTNSKEEQWQENLNKSLLWLDSLIKAHNKLVAAFARQDKLKVTFENERNISKQLNQIKNELLYLQAKVLIEEKNWTKAMVILVDITASDPQSVVAQNAYRRLKQIGFSPSE
jgi:hypothetical protein